MQKKMFPVPKNTPIRPFLLKPNFFKNGLSFHICTEDGRNSHTETSHLSFASDNYEVPAQHEDLPRH